MNQNSVSVSGLVGVVLSLLCAWSAAQTASDYAMWVVGTGALATYLGGAVSLLVRSFRPPLKFGRGLASWAGGAFAANGALGIWYFYKSIMGSAYEIGFSESIILIVVGSPLSFLLLRFGFKSVVLSRQELAEADLQKATKLEVAGDLQAARRAYERIVDEYGDTAIAVDAQSCVVALENKIRDRN